MALGVLKEMVKFQSDRQECKDAMTLVSRLLQQLQASDLNQACRTIRHFKMRECFDKPGAPKQNRFTFAIRGFVMKQSSEAGLLEPIFTDDAVLMVF